MSDDKKQLARGDTPLHLDRAEAVNNRQQRIKFRWIKEGLIRCMDSGKGNSECSEFMVYPVKRDAPTIRSRPRPHKVINNRHRHIPRPAQRQMERRYIVAKRRTEQGKIIRRQYRGDVGVPYQLVKGYALMLGGYANTITTYTIDNWIMELNKNNNIEKLTYHEHPTKEQLLEYFGPRIRIRKMTPKTAFRLMDVDDEDIDKIMNAEETVTLKDGTVKTKKAVTKTAAYRLAGNSIVVSCLYHIFRTMFLDNQPENAISQPTQLSLFD